jgi:hypothetical protein
LVTDKIGHQGKVIILNPDDIRWIGFLQDSPGKIGIGLKVRFPMGAIEMAQADEVMEKGPQSPVGKTVVVVAGLFFRQIDESELIASLALGFGNGNRLLLHGGTNSSVPTNPETVTETKNGIQGSNQTPASLNIANSPSASRGVIGKSIGDDDEPPGGEEIA